MLKNLLRKELCLAMHPTGALMLALSAMVLIPNYPYTVIFFYSTLSLFFTCLQGRENNDVSYTLTLPVARRDAVRGRFALAALIELAQLALTGAFCLVRRSLPLPANAAGLEANLSLLGAGFLLFGVFNLVFFPRYYRNIEKVGAPFALASVVFFVLVAAGEALEHAVPFVRDRLDSLDPAYLPARLAALAAGLVLWLLLTALAYRRSVKFFSRLDIA